MITLATIQSYASTVAGTPTTISCDAPSTFSPGETGYVIFLGGVPVATIHLPAPECQRLETMDTAETINPADVLTLEHEAQHIATRSLNECDVERTAIANEWPLLRMFKLAAWRAKAILDGASYVDANLLPIYHEDC